MNSAGWLRNVANTGHALDILDFHKISVRTRRFNLESKEGCGNRLLTILSSLLIASNASTFKNSLHVRYGADSFI